MGELRVGHWDLGPWSFTVQKVAKSECTAFSTLLFVVTVVRERAPVHHGGFILPYSILDPIAFPFISKPLNRRHTQLAEA